MLVGTVIHPTILSQPQIKNSSAAPGALFQVFPYTTQVISS